MHIAVGVDKQKFHIEACFGFEFPLGAIFTQRVVVMTDGLVIEEDLEIPFPRLRLRLRRRAGQHHRNR